MTIAAARTDRVSRWLPTRSSAGAARTRLFCFPHAGGGSSTYVKWPMALGPDVEVCAVEYPGRWSRHREPLVGDARQLVAMIFDDLQDLFDGNHVLLGYSFGSLIALEVALLARERGVPPPRHLVACARHAPSVRVQATPLHTMSDAAFVSALELRYGALPDAVRRDPDLMAMVLPIIRADFRALETYQWQTQPPLASPITAVYGADDTLVDESNIDAWAAHTTAGFARHKLPGGHFFIDTHVSLLHKIVRDVIAS